MRADRRLLCDDGVQARKGSESCAPSSSSLARPPLVLYQNHVPSSIPDEMAKAELGQGEARQVP